MANFFDQLGDILFLDIETASLTEKFEDLSSRLQDEWIKKEKLIQNEHGKVEPGALYFDKAGIHAEFGQVICIGVGYFQWKKRTRSSFLDLKFLQILTNGNFFCHLIAY
ncbi:hypothetical protein V8V91_20315 [Algoriphagus halophilus]|uniref:hypothetical protein n=1 Tax=Algoriphagus halophilus TaxID=226505 RepID=UPI00358E6E38